MAGFCTKCGTALAPDTRSCPACGTPVAVVPAFAPVAPPPPPVAPPQQGTSAVKIVLIILGIVFGLGILAAGAFGFFVWRVAHSIHVSGNGEQVTINTPAGHLSADSTEKFTASDIGTDLYPGAEPTKGGMRMTLPTGSMVSAAYLTSDSRDQVLAFYKSKLPGNASTFNTDNGAVVTWNKDQNESIVITITSSPSEFDGKTQIHIVHTTKSS